MANDNNINNFGATDIEKYHKGLLTPKERHALEKAALDDPFLADALEGYAIEGVNANADINELKQRLAERTERAKVVPMYKGGRSSFPWLRAAAAVVLIAAAGYFAYQFAFTGKKEVEIAKVQQPVSKEQTPPTTADSITGEATNTELVGSTTNNQSSGNSTFTITPGLTTDKNATQNGGNYKAADTMSTISNEVFKNADLAKQTQTKEPVKDISPPRPSATAPVKEKTEDNLATNKALKDTDGVSDRFTEMERAKTANRSRAENLQYHNQANIFRGRVTDNNNNGIPFANVTNVQDNVGTYTDARGYFNLTSPDSILNVQTRALGFNNYNIQLRNSQQENKVVMQEDQGVAANILSDKKINSERRARDPNFKLEGEPEPEDGWDTYDSYLANNLNIPKEFKPKQTEVIPTVEVSFEVNKNGDPVNFKVEKSLCNKCDEEAIRLIKEGPKWKRKARKGRTRVAITF